MKSIPAFARYIGLSAALTALALGGYATPAIANPVVETHPFISETAGPPPGAGFEDPCGAAVDSSGTRYLSDYFHDAIDLYSGGGGFGGQIAEADPGNGPCGLAVDSSQRLYVNDWRHQIVRYTPPYGSAEAIDPGPATGVAVDALGNVYVDDGTYIAKYEGPVESGDEPTAKIGLGTLGEGFGVAVSTFPATLGDVYVPDAADHMVKVYDPLVDTVDPVGVIDGHGTPQGGFTYLVDSATAVDPSDGHLFVVDNLQHGQTEHPEAAVDEFNAAGAYRGQIARWITHPQNEPGVSIEHHLTDAEPSGLAISPNGHLYVTSGNYQEGEVSGLDKEGKRIEGGRLYEFGPTDHAYTLTMVKGGSGEGIVTSKPAGISCDSACAAEFNVSEVVTLTATPDSHSSFGGWSGGDCAGSGSCTVTMSEARTVTAEFIAIPQQTLTVTKTGSGEGAVTSEPTGIDCGAICMEHFNEGSVVTLKANPPIHNRLVRWSGCTAEPGSEECDVTMNSAKGVEVEFAAIPQVTLEVLISGPGSVRSEPIGIACGEVCSEHFDEGSMTTLVASPAPHDRVIWSGCSAGPSASECAVTMSSATSVTAHFVPIEHRLSILVVGGGSVSADHGAIGNCTASAGACTGIFHEGEAITLNATPAAESVFAGWSGGSCGGIGPCHLAIESDAVVTANFAAIPHFLLPPIPSRITFHGFRSTGGKGVLDLSLSGPGVVEAKGRYIQAVTAHATGAGMLGLRLALSQAGRQTLARRSKLKVQVFVTFSPGDGGTPAGASKVLTFMVGKRQSKGKRHVNAPRGFN